MERKRDEKQEKDTQIKTSKTNSYTLSMTIKLLSADSSTEDKNKSKRFH